MKCDQIKRKTPPKSNAPYGFYSNYASVPGWPYLKQWASHEKRWLTMDIMRFPYTYVPLESVVSDLDEQIRFQLLIVILLRLLLLVCFYRLCHRLFLWIV